jgi:superoxide reductase
MSEIGSLVQTADWKSEKHVPVIEAPDSVKAGDAFNVTASVGKEISHPNTTEHHIRWIQLFFKPDNDKFSYQLSNGEFTAHGEAVKGANEGPAYTEPHVQTSVSIKQSGTLHALSYCNIHGLWESTKRVEVG